MQLRSVSLLLRSLINGGRNWQFITINGDELKPRFYFSDIQWGILLISAFSLLILENGLSKEMVGYIMSAFAVSVTLFMSLLVSIFDKFEKTDFTTTGKNDSEITRLKQKKNFFKRFISVTSYLVVLSIFIIVLCSVTYIFRVDEVISPSSLTTDTSSIDIPLTIKFVIIITYRITLNYFLLSYLTLTLFITASAYEFYISEIDNKKIQ